MKHVSKTAVIAFVFALVFGMAGCKPEVKPGVSKVVVTFDSEYGTPFKSITIDEGTALTVIPEYNDVIDEKIHTAWLCNGVKVSAGFVVNENVTLTAKWISIHTNLYKELTREGTLTIGNPVRYDKEELPEGFGQQSVQGLENFATVQLLEDGHTFEITTLEGYYFNTDVLMARPLSENIELIRNIYSEGHPVSHTIIPMDDYYVYLDPSNNDLNHNFRAEKINRVIKDYDYFYYVDETTKEVILTKTNPNK